MNGNDLANVLKYSGGEWRAHEPLPEEWWKTDFPYGKALEMGYQLSPEEARRFREREYYKGKAIKTLSEEMADVLASDEYRALPATDKAKVIKTFQDIKAAQEKREEEKKAAIEARLTKDEYADLMDRGRREGWKSWQYMAYLMALGVDPEKSQYIGKLMAPEPEALEAAQAEALRYKTKRTEEEDDFLEDYIKRNPEYEHLLAPTDKIKLKIEADRAKEAHELAIRKEERESRSLDADIQDKKNRLNLEYAKLEHTIDVDKETANLARDKFDLDVKKYGLDVAIFRAKDKLSWADFGLRSEEAQQKAAQWVKEFELDVKELGLKSALNKHNMEIDWAKIGIDITAEENKVEEWRKKHEEWEKKYGADRADAMFDRVMREKEFKQEVKEADNDYEIEVLKESHAWKESMFNMGFKDREFIELSKQFYDTLDFNKEKEKTRAKEAGIKLEFDKEKEANVMDRFDKSFDLECKALDLEVKKFGLDRDKEKRISTMAILNFGLDVKRLGLDEAIQKFKAAEAKKEWYWREKEFPLKQSNAMAYYKQVMHNITQDAKEFGLKVAIHKENIRQSIADMEYKYKALEQKGETQKIEITGDTAVALDSLGPKKKDLAVKAIAASAGYQPTTTELQRIYNVILGEEEEISEEDKKKLPVNLPLDEFIVDIMKKPTLSQKTKGWLIRARKDPYLWEGFVDEAIREGKYLGPGEEEKTEGSSLLSTLMTPLTFGPTVVKKIKHWWRGKEPEVKPEISAEDAAREILTNLGLGTTRAQLRGALRNRGYSEEEIDRVIRGE